MWVVVERISCALPGGHHSRKGGGQFLPAVAMSPDLVAQISGHDADGETDHPAQKRVFLPHAAPDAHELGERDHHSL